MELSNLVGTHYLTGIDIGQMDYEDDWGDTQTGVQFVKFQLDGENYLAVEDPDDGYRSHCRELMTSDEGPRFCFPPVDVTCTMASDNVYNKHDILVFTDNVTGKVILEIGTESYDDWYPCFHFLYRPEDMYFNQDTLEVEIAEGFDDII